MNIATEKTIVVDYKQPTRHKTITFLQYDTNIINFVVEDNGAAANLSNITKIEVNFRRPDRKVISQILTSVGNKITYQLTDSEMSKSGDCELVLQLHDDKDRLSIARVKVNISENIESSETPTVEEIRLVEQLVEIVNGKLEELSELEKGAQGQKGDKGDTGSRGLQGERGLQGIQGVKGDPGERGEKGEKGDNGYNGMSASHSWNGTFLTVSSSNGTSIADLKGEKGDAGAKGDTGLQGIQGVKGDKGDTGQIGPKGDKGDTPILNNSVTSTSTTEAATANAVKMAYDRANAAFTQASDNKLTIVNAVTGKGGTATSNDTYAQLSAAITNLPTGKKWANGTFTDVRTLSVTGIGFKPSVVIVRGKFSNDDLFTLSTYVNTIIDITPANILNSYTFTASSVDMGLLDSTMTTTDNGFTLEIVGIDLYSGMWIAYE